MAGPPAAWSWEIEVPLLSREILRGYAMAVGLAILLAAAFVGVGLVANGAVDAIPGLAAMLALVALVALAVFGAGFVVAWVLFRGAIRMRYVVDGEGVSATVVERGARAANRAAVALGFIAGRPGAAGAGLIAIGQETVELRWDGAFRASFDAAAGTITFRNAWRPLLVVHAGAADFEPVARLVREGMAKAGTAVRAAAAPSPLVGVLRRTAVAVLGSVALFPLVDAFDVDGFLPFLVLAFAVAMVWLVSLFAWVVMGGLVVIGGSVGLALAATSRSILQPGVTYRGWELLSDDDVAALVLAVVGAGLLLWLAVRALRGEAPSMLERDAADQG